MILNLFRTIRECQHNNVSPDVERAYCPDCGTFVQNKWYLTRCSCCNIKRVSYSNFNMVRPISKFCPNCGSKDFYLEELDHINFIDVNFAVVKKVETLNQAVSGRSQIWVDEKENQPQKLLGLMGK